ncbi:MAG: hypothetical protein K0S58_3259 [Nitrospira sp.]|jgi:hypothetical protein|nr:hypothetical protein [Nitrospira sp.]
MHSPRLDPIPTPCCRHQRLIERVRCEDATEPLRFRCLECGAVVEEQEPAAGPE